MMTAAGGARMGRNWPAASASRARRRASSSAEVKRRWRQRLRRKSSAAVCPSCALHSTQQETRLRYVFVPPRAWRVAHRPSLWKNLGGADSGGRPRFNSENVFGWRTLRFSRCGFWVLPFQYGVPAIERKWRVTSLTFLACVLLETTSNEFALCLEREFEVRWECRLGAPRI